MLITDLKKEFYEQLVRMRVLILVDYDIDSICASKILQFLLRTDHILYTVVPVKTKTDLYNVYHQHAHQIKDIILINCGGTIDIVEFLQPAADVRFFIADCHRPFDVCNVYNDGQVKIISRLGDDEEVPGFDDVFREDSDSEMESDEEEDTHRFSEEMLEKRREKRLWDQRRQKILFDYSQFSYYGESSALLMYELAWVHTKDSNEVLWWGIVGHTHLLMTGKVDLEKYLLVTANLQGHVSRLNHKSQDERPLDTLRISFEKELQLVLYRHWTLVESMKHSPYTATTFKLWTLKGEKRMHELLAEIGLPLVECRQKFTHMDVTLRGQVQSLLESRAERYGLEGLIIASFALSHGFRSRFSALDYALATAALLESPHAEKTSADCFLDASESLSISNLKILEAGIDLSKQQMGAIYRQVTTFLNMGQIISAGPFLYATVLQGSADSIFFSSQCCLSRLAQFTLRAHVSTSRSRKSKGLPLILSAPDTKNPFKSEDDEGASKVLDTCLICGIPPMSEESHKNFFGKAFEQAVEKTQARAELDSFDSNIIRIVLNDRSKFFDALIALLS